MTEWRDTNLANIGWDIIYTDCSTRFLYKILFQDLTVLSIELGVPLTARTWMERSRIIGLALMDILAVISGFQWQCARLEAKGSHVWKEVRKWLGKLNTRCENMCLEYTEWSTEPEEDLLSRWSKEIQEFFDDPPHVLRDCKLAQPWLAHVWQWSVAQGDYTRLFGRHPGGTSPDEPPDEPSSRRRLMPSRLRGEFCMRIGTKCPVHNYTWDGDSCKCGYQNGHYQREWRIRARVNGADAHALWSWQDSL